jgi:rod shape determining protein RodA
MNSNKLKTFDLLLFLIPILLLIIGISVIYSLVIGTADSGLIFKQIASAVIAIVLAIAVSFVDYRFFKSVAWFLYLLVIALLIYVDFFGVAAGGAMRWIDLGFFQLQPSELAKPALALILSSFFSTKIGKFGFRDIFFSFLIVLPPVLLILKEPDLGTALVIIFLYVILILFSKPNKFQLTIFALILGLAVIFAVLSVRGVRPFDRILHDYQKNRILTFIDPSLDPYGKGYNVRQAQITVGSGGIFGKGLGRGSQSQLQFLPKPQTDFIFAGIAESFGFLGLMIYLTLFVVLIIRIINISVFSKDNFGMLICIGAVAIILFQTVVNMGMNIGLVPVTGIPLPFASYGGSALISYFFILGICQSIIIRHKKINF